MEIVYLIFLLDCSLLVIRNSVDFCVLTLYPATLLSYNRFSYGIFRSSQVGLVVKNPPANAGDVRDVSSIPCLGRSPGGRHGNPLQYSCLENPTDRGAWRAVVHRVAKSQT